MGQIWTDELEAEHTRQRASEIEPPASSSVQIDDADLLLRDVLRGGLAHLLAVVRHRLLQGSPPTFSLGDQILYAEFNRKLAEPKPELGPDASGIERWLAEDLTEFQGQDEFFNA